jgi:regulatory protein
MEQNEKDLKRAKNAAYRYLTIRQRSRAEVRKKLDDRGFDADIVRSVMEHLDRLGYLDDRQFARDWAASRVRMRGYGRLRIEQELRIRGIDRETVREAVAGLFDETTEAEVAKREAEKRLRTMARLEPEARRRRLAGFLERRGFPSDVIRTILATVK